MSEKILRALMQLFAIIAKVEIIEKNHLEGVVEEEDIFYINFREDSAVVESFLRSELNSIHVKKYLDLFDEFIQIHHGIKSKKDGIKKRTSVNSVKVLKICSQINQELTQRQKFIVLIRLFEFINSTGRVSEQDMVFVETVSEMFNVSEKEYDLLKSFLESSSSDVLDNENILYITHLYRSFENAKIFLLEGIDSEIRVLRIKSIGTFFYRYFGSEELIMNGQIVPNRTHILNQGATIKTHKSQPIYYSDIISHFFTDHLTEKITLKVTDLEYSFKSGKVGIQKTSFIEESGKLFGIMGGSGTGKSTFLNILNGNLNPSSGSVLINGIDVHKEKNKLEGIIGFISQDDLLIEELTVYQNLFYNAKLCFNNLSKRVIQKKVLEMLSSIGLLEVKDLVVGNPLDQTISGGQRKRLNIALELIREPSVLFVDEPTSGLSSRDSENIIDLLKELALKGKLIFVVIHQPSSEIFKMFDRLLIIDKGGYPIFDGNPIDAVVYFKTHIHHVNAEERECYACGNVNPEQIFNIIESKVVDEYGNLTSNRKTSPNEWNELFKEHPNTYTVEEQDSKLISNSHRPNKINQFKIFFIRDFLSKIVNRQYVIVNLFEAPVLALILSFFVKYYNNFTKGYSFYENVNLPQYIFIAVIVSLFLGLTVAAEEIFKDRKILKRESFLNLSRSSYLFSKISILFLISGIQTFLFTLIGNSILEIKGLFFEYWAILFSMSCLANIIGLLISSAFNSVKVIYIIVPLIIIPQLLFSGVIVKFDKLNPIFSKTNEVPWLGNSMAVRWAYEALTVTQSIDNEFEKNFFTLDQQRTESEWKKDFWIPEMTKHVSNLDKPFISNEEFQSSKRILFNEMKSELSNWSNLTCSSCNSHLAKINKYDSKIPIIKAEITDILTILNNQFVENYKSSTAKIEDIITKIGDENYRNLRDKYENESLNDLVTNRREVDKIITVNDQLIQKDNPIFKTSASTPFFYSHFYSPYKYFFGAKISTFWGNMMILWVMSISFLIALYFNWLKRCLRFLRYSNYFYKKRSNSK